MRDYDHDDYDYPSDYKRVEKQGLGHGDPHVAAKKEGIVLRRLMSQNGMSEGEIRKIPKFRKILSEAYKKSMANRSKLTRIEKWKKIVMKRVTRRLGLAKEHPETKKAFHEEWTAFQKDNWYFLSW